MPKVTVAYGNGIGPEIMTAVLSIMAVAEAPIEPEVIEIGEDIYKKGFLTGIEDKSWDIIYKNKTFLKAPITTPQGGGFRSLNVSIRKALGLYANVRPCVSYHPFVETKNPGMDVVVVRENEEDLYTGIEYRQTREAHQALKILSQTGSEKIIRYAFEYAVQNDRKKVTCFTKDNIMKISDGLFHKTFDRVAKEYPEIENEHWIVDIGMAKAAVHPENFDVIVVPNLYGDILSDILAQVTGSVGLAGSANIGGEYAMFEAIHGSAPRRAGQGVANPSGLLLAAVQMLVHLNLVDSARAIHNAWLKTIEDGVHTYDIFREGLSRKKAGTKDFAKAVSDRLGESPKTLESRSYKPMSLTQKTMSSKLDEKKDFAGFDIFIDESKLSVEDLVGKIQLACGESFALIEVSNRGLQFWPGSKPLAGASDYWRCRFLCRKPKVSKNLALNLMVSFEEAGLDIAQFEALYNFDGQPGFSGPNQI